MHNPTQGAVKIELGGTAYTLRFDFEAIAEAEDLTGKPLLTGLRERDVTSPTISLVRAMFYACLLPEHPYITFEQAKAMVTRKTLTDIWVKVLEAWSLSAPPAEEDQAATDPTEGQS
jgi:hypothetical protein